MKIMLSRLTDAALKEKTRADILDFLRRENRYFVEDIPAYEPGPARQDMVSWHDKSKKLEKGLALVDDIEIGGLSPMMAEKVKTILFRACDEQIKLNSEEE